MPNHFLLLYGTDELIAVGTDRKSKSAYIPPNIYFPYFLISAAFRKKQMFDPKIRNPFW